MRPNRVHHHSIVKWKGRWDQRWHVECWDCGHFKIFTRWRPAIANALQHSEELK